MTGPAEDAPLAGRRVLVTRGADRSTGLVERLRARGAEVVEIPLLEIAAPDDPRPLREAIAALEEYDWLLVTSANAAHALEDAIRLAGARLPKALRVASAGPATTEAIRARLPETPVTAQATTAFGGEGLARALALVDVKGTRMLFPVSDRSPAALADVLRARGARVDVVVAYRTLIPPHADDRLRAALARGIDLVTFASPSAVDAFVRLAAGARVPAAVIGRTTADAGRAAGLAIAAVAEEATGDGLAAAVEEYFAQMRKTR